MIVTIRNYRTGGYVAYEDVNRVELDPNDQSILIKIGDNRPSKEKLEDGADVSIHLYSDSGQHLETKRRPPRDET